ncbi:S9 family peptidase [Pseudidiomarina sp.]|uniref:S9 family peptidase n=1 Tax=Pseudidiomarina sp. TaxID=2081707 RepID=UPI00299EAD81|nr:S9 family peptidase [Pseudidiomarina sp.]MDX1705849.1 S9 family peptidase [Pseudidiomarina sp.]
MRFLGALTAGLLGLGLCWPLTAAAQTEITSEPAALTIERIFSAPDLTTVAPQQLRFAPRGNHISYLKGSVTQPDVYDLWLYSIRDDKHRLLVAAKELTQDPSQVSAAEQARRERQRIRADGIVEYHWSPDGQSLLFPLAGQLYLYNIATATTTTLTSSTMSATDARFSPAGSYVSFIHEHNLWLVDLPTTSLRQLTTDGSLDQMYGTAEFVAQEEMKRMTGYWWSPDEQRIALTRVDKTPIATTVRADVSGTGLVQQRYPYAGSANALVDLGILTVPDAAEKTTVTWLNLAEHHGDGYLARVDWVTDSKRLGYQWQNRSQNQLGLYLLDAEQPVAGHNLVLQESAPTWVNLHDDLIFLNDARHFIWASERSGYKHLYLYRLDGSLIRQLTSGDWMVDQVSRVDETTGYIYFTGRKDTPLERHLYRASMNTSNPSQPTRLSDRDGMHEITFGADARSYIDYFSSSTQPPQVSLHGPTGERISWLHQNQLDNSHPLAPYLTNWQFPEFGHLTAADGQRLYYRLTRPTQFVDNQRYPVIVMVYGGPRAQRVTNSWGHYFSQYLAQQGYVVFQLDNRGSGNRGRQFETGIYRQLAMLEVEDQRRGAEFVRQLPFVDPDRVGVFGHSYGGYLALHLILRADDLFSAAVAGAPVTDWSLYDTHYTERYLGTPQNNAEGYQQASVLTYSDQLKKPLLIYHGLADDNVLFEHSGKLFKAFQDKALPFEMMAYPGKQHGLSGRATSIHRYQLIADFFARHL